MKLKTIWQMIRETITEFSNDRALTLGAALAYYALFSIAPLLVIIMGMAGVILSEQSARQQLTQQLQSVMGENTARMVQSMMAAQTKTGGIVATVIGVVILIFGASGIFGQLKESLNVILDIQPKPGQGIVRAILSRALAILMVLVLGLLFIAAMLLTTFVAGFGQQIQTVLPIPNDLIQLLNLALMLTVITLLFVLIFKILPDAHVGWRAIWVGSLVTAVLFLVGQYALSFYLSRQSTASVYGAAGSTVVLLLWVYYSSLILFLGAEFLQVYARATQARLVPSKHAEFIPQQQPQPAQAQPSPPAVAPPAPPRPAPAAPTPAPAHALAVETPAPHAEHSRELPKSRFVLTNMVRRQPWAFLGVAMGLGMWLARKERS